MANRRVKKSLVFFTAAWHEHDLSTISLIKRAIQLLNFKLRVNIKRSVHAITPLVLKKTITHTSKLNATLCRSAGSAQ